MRNDIDNAPSGENFMNQLKILNSKISSSVIQSKTKNNQMPSYP